MLTRKRRDRLTIIAQILNIARERTLKTHIMYRANLSFAQVTYYLSFLQELGFLDVKTKDGRAIFKRTPKGVKYLENFAEIKDLLKKTSEQNPRGLHGMH